MSRSFPCLDSRQCRSIPWHLYGASALIILDWKKGRQTETGSAFISMETTALNMPLPGHVCLHSSECACAFKKEGVFRWRFSLGCGVDACAGAREQRLRVRIFLSDSGRSEDVVLDAVLVYSVARRVILAKRVKMERKYAWRQLALCALWGFVCFFYPELQLIRSDSSSAAPFRPSLIWSEGTLFPFLNSSSAKQAVTF